VKLRSDKTKPNTADVAVHIWEDIHNPIDEDTIRGNKFSLMFRYHNRIKWDIFREISHKLPKVDGNSRTILSIGAGKGGDVYKWETYGFTHVIAVEPNDENRLELKRRLDSTNLKYLILSTIGQDYTEIIKAIHEFVPDKSVDVVSYMLSLSFFFDNNESLNSIYHLAYYILKPGGFFISYSIDGKYVKEYFNKTENYKMINGIKRGNFEKITFELRPPENSPTVFVNIPDSIVTNQTEFLTNLPLLFEYLSKTPLNLELLSNKRAIDEKFMTEEEVIFSSFFTSSILQRL